ncbi:hypothetical protein K523DRAFT_422323 [Schizophyllum commune Tattone D]|nr:hypothetical protein K523DRAFT_422323 [Schizophyllum commune Tattone D]
MRVTRCSIEYKTLRDLFDITDPHKPGSYGSARYTKLLFQPGACYICKGKTPGPPECLEPNVYLCSEECKATFFRKKLCYPRAKFNHRLAHSPCPKLDRFIIPWLPLFTMNRFPKDEKVHGILASDLEKARKEYQEALADPDGRDEREQALFAQYAIRYQRHKALLQFQICVDEWRLFEWDKDIKETARTNERRVRHIALDYGANPGETKRNPTVQQIVATRTRELRRITRSTLKAKQTLLSNSESNRRACGVCGAIVDTHRLDPHIAQHHPDRLSHSRTNAATGKTEFCCELCPVARVKWFSATGLESHKFDVHGLRPRDGKEGLVGTVTSS